MGTDELGRDQLTEILYAGQISLKIGMAVALMSTAIGAKACSVPSKIINSRWRISGRGAVGAKETNHEA